MPNLPLAELVEKRKRSASDLTGPVLAQARNSHNAQREADLHDISRYAANTHKKAAERSAA
jgi:hypothetical protein